METTQQSFVLGFWGVRYQVKDVQRAIAFYTKVLGFKLDFQNLPAFGQVSTGGLKLILSGPGASGSRPMPDGRAAGSWGLEPDRAARRRPAGPHRRTAAERCSLPKHPGSRSRRPANSAGRPRRQPDRTLRARPPLTPSPAISRPPPGSTALPGSTPLPGSHPPPGSTPLPGGGRLRPPANPLRSGPSIKVC